MLKKITLIIWFLLLLPLHQAAAEESPPQAKLPHDSIYQLSSVWQSTDGRSLQLHELRGKPRLVAMFYATCHSSCPVVIDEMKRIISQLSPEENSKLGAVLFSFDPEADTAQSLETYAHKRQLDLKQWQILRGANQDILELAIALGVKYKRNSDGSFSHSNLILLLDADGRIVARFQDFQTDPQKAADEVKRHL